MCECVFGDSYNDIIIFDFNVHKTHNNVITTTNPHVNSIIKTAAAAAANVMV